MDKHISVLSHSVEMEVGLVHGTGNPGAFWERKAVRVSTPSPSLRPHSSTEKALLQNES